MEEREDKLTLIIETANTRVQEIINDALMFGYNKLYCKTLILQLVEKTANELKDNGASDYLIQDTKIAILKAFMKEWLQVITILENKLNKDNLGFIGKILEAMQTKAPLSLKADVGITIDLIDNESVGIAKAGIKNLRDFVTTTEFGGTSRFVDYRTMLQNTLLEVKDKIANGTLTLTDSMGRTKSIRNMAEIETRYKMINEDLKRQGVENGSFVMRSSHSDSSLRCSFWQRRIYLVDLDVATRPMGEFNPKNPPTPVELGKIDGKPYYSLKQACENGFLSYNCQHRLIKYYKGIKPVVYKKDFVEMRRELTIRQRQMENTIRHWKRKENLADRVIKVKRKNPITGIEEEFTDYEWTTLNSQLWQDKYRSFSEAAGLPVYTWRTRITSYEK